MSIAPLSADEPLGPDLIDEMIKSTSLDVLLDRDPREMSDDAFMNLLIKLRADRAMFNTKEETKKLKKQGLLPTEEDAEDVAS